MKCAILISLHNSETTLDKAFESILAQTFQDFRIIAIDDHSTDRTFAKLKKWQLTFGSEKFFLVKNTHNLGLTKSLNKGLSNITEPYTARIDGDDWWEPSKLEKQIAFLEAHPDHGIVGCNYRNEKNDIGYPVRCPESDESIKRSLIRRNPFAHSSVMFRTPLIRDAGNYDERLHYGQDYELWLRVSPKTRYHNLQEFLCHRNANSGLSFDHQNEQMHQCIKTQIRYIKKLHRSPLEYRFLLEPLAVILTPGFIKDLKRKFL